MVAEGIMFSEIELRDSTIDEAGQGLFAIRRIQPKKFLTEYPGIMIKFSDFQQLTKVAGEANDFEKVNELNEYTQYCGKKDGEDYVLVASKNMRNLDEGVGHLVNDGGDMDLDFFTHFLVLYSGSAMVSRYSGTGLMALDFFTFFR